MPGKPSSLCVISISLQNMLRTCWNFPAFQTEEWHPCISGKTAQNSFAAQGPHHGKIDIRKCVHAGTCMCVHAGTCMRIQHTQTHTHSDCWLPCLVPALIPCFERIHAQESQYMEKIRSSPRLQEHVLNFFWSQKESMHKALGWNPSTTYKIRRPEFTYVVSVDNVARSRVTWRQASGQTGEGSSRSG